MFADALLSSAQPLHRSLLRAIWLRLKYLILMARLVFVEAAWRKLFSRCWLPEACVVKQAVRSSL